MLRSESCSVMDDWRRDRSDLYQVHRLLEPEFTSNSPMTGNV
jgi:NADPH-dependent 7-cyano-7-deazaguanine reductase QueF